MQLLSIEPTPSPNAMKLNVDESLPSNVRYSLTASDAAKAPGILAALLAVPGVKSLFRSADFISLEREGSADWRDILAGVHEVFGAGPDAAGTPADAGAAAQIGTSSYGEAQVLVQMFRGIPMQVRVRAGMEESRVALPQRFSDSAMKAGLASMNLIRERTLVDRGVRYGELPDIAAEVTAELDAAYDDERLAELVAQAEAMGEKTDAAPAPAEPAVRLTPEEISDRLDDGDWKVRYAALEQLTPSPETLPVLAKALSDSNFSVRRLAVAGLGEINEPASVQHLVAMLKDKSAPVRRTAGDALSDIGDASAQPAMIEALRDKSKIVRWRAARFLYDLGDEAALDALRIAVDDPEFEVALQARMALERIESGEAAAGTVWQQMARDRGKQG